MNSTSGDHMFQKPTEILFCTRQFRAMSRVLQRVPLLLLNPYINPSSPSPTILFSSDPAVHWKGRDSSGFLGGEEKQTTERFSKPNREGPSDAWDGTVTLSHQ